MREGLVELASELFAKVGRTTEGQRRIHGYRHVYQFEIDGVQEFYVRVEEGVLEVGEGVYEGEYGMVSLVKTDSDTLEKVLKGKLRALDASKEGKWVIRARAYSGELLYTLLRIGRDMTAEELLAAQG